MGSCRKNDISVSRHLINSLYTFYLLHTYTLTIGYTSYGRSISFRTLSHSYLDSILVPGILDKFLQTHILSQIGLSLGNALTVPRNDLRLWDNSLSVDSQCSRS